MIDKSKIKMVKDDKVNSDKMKILSDTMFNGATYTINFVWIYMLSLYEKEWDKSSYSGFITEYIAKRIDEMKSDLRNLQSINQVYVYLYNAKEKLGGFIPLEELKERIPSYTKSIDIDKINEYLKEDKEST